MTDTLVPSSFVAAPTPQGQPPAQPMTSPWRALATIVVALALYLVLFDAAIETVRSGAPLRWWLAGAVAAYLAISIGLWQMGRARARRFTWGVSATTSFVVLFGLLAVTVWLPEGVTVGVTIFGLSTSTLLEAVVAAGVALAGLVLVRLPRIPVAVKWGLAALAAYCVAGFVHGAIVGTPFPALFAGHSLWQRLPYLFQSAFLGGLVVLPLALVVSVIRAGLRRTHVDSVRRTFHEGVALVTSLTIVLAAISPAGWRGQSPTGQEATGQPALSGTNASTAAFATTRALSTHEREQFDQQFRAIEAFAATVPKDTFDPEAVLAKTGRDPSAIFYWVRDSTLWVPYRGVLRGPVGVLMDRKGNDLRPRTPARPIVQVGRTGSPARARNAVGCASSRNLGGCAAEADRSLSCDSATSARH